MKPEPDARPWRGLYKTARWKQLRLHHLAHHPLCVMCDRPQSATIVDHIKPHKGDETLFFDPDNLQALCPTHHNSTKQRQERRGYEQGCDASGVPLDAGSHWREG